MFDFGKNTFLGVDIGSHSIKMVEIKLNSGKPVLTNYAWMKINSLSERRDIALMFMDNVLPECIKAVYREGEFDSKEANVSVPASGGLITLVEFPEVIREDLDEAIKFEAHKYIPTSLEDVVFSWDVVGLKKEKKLFKMGEKKEAPSDSQSKMQVLLVAASKSKVVKYEQAIKKSGLNVQSMELESFSLVRSLVGNDQGNFVLVDIGHKVCNIILVEKGIIKVNRNIDSGGADITRAVVRSMGVDEKRAENIKINNHDLLKKESNLSFPSLDLITAEVLRVLKAYYKNEEKSKVDSLILSGGVANISGIDGYFQEALGIKTIIGNPLSRLECDKKIEPIASKVKSNFAVAIGLALRGSGENK